MTTPNTNQDSTPNHASIDGDTGAIFNRSQDSIDSLEEIIEKIWMLGVNHQMQGVPEMDKTLEQAKAAINTHILAEVLALLPEKHKGLPGSLGELPLHEKDRGYNQAIDDIEAKAKTKYGGKNE